MRATCVILFACCLLTVVSCTQQLGETEPLPAEIQIGEKYRFAYSLGSGNVTVLQTSNGWVKVRDAHDQIAWVNPHAIISISEYQGN